MIQIIQLQKDKICEYKFKMLTQIEKCEKIESKQNKMLIQKATYKNDTKMIQIVKEKEISKTQKAKHKTGRKTNENKQKQTHKT